MKELLRAPPNTSGSTHLVGPSQPFHSKAILGFSGKLVWPQTCLFLFLSPTTSRKKAQQDLSACKPHEKDKALGAPNFSFFVHRIQDLVHISVTQGYLSCYGLSHLGVHFLLLPQSLRGTLHAPASSPHPSLPVEMVFANMSATQ